MKLLLFTMASLLTISISSSNSFSAQAVNLVSIGNEINIDQISKTYTPKPRKGMKWTYNMKAPFSNGDYISEIITVDDENIVVKSTTPKKTTTKKVRLIDFSLVPKMKDSASKPKLKYMGTENITLYGKNYKAEKFVGDIDTPVGKSKTDFWYAENIGLLKMFSQGKFLGIAINVNFELKDFSNS